MRWSLFWELLPSLQRTSAALLEWLLGFWSPRRPRPLLPCYSLWTTANCRKSPGGSRLLPFHNYWGHCASRTLHSLVLTQFYHRALQSDFLFVLSCSVNFGTFCTQVCVFLNYVQSISFANRCQVLELYLCGICLFIEQLPLGMKGGVSVFLKMLNYISQKTHSGS